MLRTSNVAPADGVPHLKPKFKPKQDLTLRVHPDLSVDNKPTKSKFPSDSLCWTQVKIHQQTPSGRNRNISSSWLRW